MSQNSPKEKGISYFAVAFLILVLLNILITFMGDGRGEQDYRSLYFLLVPITVFVGMQLTQSCIRHFLAGKISEIMHAAAQRLGIGIIIYTAIWNIPENRSGATASNIILLLTIVYTLQCINAFLKEYILLHRIVKSVLYIFQAVIYGVAAFYLWPDGIWDMNMDFSAGVMVIAGFFTLYLCTMLSLLELAEKPRWKALGHWFDIEPAKKFFFACGMIFIFKDLRTVVRDSFSGQLALGEWLFMFLILLVLFFLMIQKLRSITQVLPALDLKKHIQEIRYFKDQELTNLAGVIDRFILEGDKSMLCMHLVFAGNSANMSKEDIGKLIKPLIDYCPLPLPRFCFKWELRLLEERNLENRSRLLVRIIQDFKYFGREKDEYGRCTS